MSHRLPTRVMVSKSEGRDGDRRASRHVAVSCLPQNRWFLIAFQPEGGERVPWRHCQHAGPLAASGVQELLGSRRRLSTLDMHDRREVANRPYPCAALGITHVIHTGPDRDSSLRCVARMTITHSPW
jgi:hypothetical protein